MKQVISNASFINGVRHTDLANTGSHANITTNPEFVRGTNKVWHFITFAWKKNYSWNALL
jgi:hypothetical protein